MNGKVEQKLGTAAYLLVIETEDMSFEVMAGPSRSAGPGAGVQIISQVVGMGARIILVGQVAPHIVKTLGKQGINVINHVSGPVSEALSAYLHSEQSLSVSECNEVKVEQATIRDEWIDALLKGLRQFYTLLPRLVGVILLLSLFRGFVPEQTLLSLFSGSALYDSFWGASLGSFMAGNPVNSYVIGHGLLEAGVGLTGVMALMLAWVSVGVIQIPAESAALGLRFALVRNAAGFVVVIFVSLVVFLLGGGI
ncbi:NifB/NifX family molybdenum-iron cluster-binding protein [Maridesulfovibrio ferrireducens]|uniref:NifB/NifX family molybdenum-iron cluster-binding protein n=1 Tax=Maridesulfovibrio ferrireducens TaxID=246191 RepID=UPI001A228716|nr:NifB/NifX family molybdenum-iron cluster-binding protein [Maridesulfovibrio ferrireducens]MBI9113089.1 NifB/NifX family molybdenum-iron cluster-binding protein [Maridesulfovibrio ferrireducens]